MVIVRLSFRAISNPLKFNNDVMSFLCSTQFSAFILVAGRDMNERLSGVRIPVAFIDLLKSFEH